MKAVISDSSGSNSFLGSYQDSLDYLTRIGNDGEGTAGFLGFIYNFAIRDSELLLIDLLSNILSFSCSGSCGTCPADGECIPECSYSDYSKDCVTQCNCGGLSCKTTSEDCIKCHSTCQGDCTGPFAEDCVDFTYKYCDPHPFEPALGECNFAVECSANCYYCQNETECLECDTGFFLDPFTNQCQNSCPSSYFGNSQEKSCEKCHRSCGECKGPSELDCIVCSDSNASLLSECECNLGYFGDSWNCQECVEYCEVCQNSLTCKKCQANYYLQPNYLCALSCPTEYYKDTESMECRKVSDSSGDACSSGYYESSGECIKCHYSCKTCNGGTSSNCLTCSDSRELSRTGSCECPKGTFEASKDPFKCTICYETCTQCTAIDNCTICNEPVAPSKGLCEKIEVETDFVDKNTFVLEFNQKLLKDLNKTNFEINIGVNTSFTYQVSKQSSFNYTLEITYRGNITKPTNLTISVLDVTYRVLEFSFQINATQDSFKSSSDNSSKANLANAISNAVKLNLILNILVMLVVFEEPSSLWTFLNTAQIICYMPLHNISLPENLYNFLVSFKTTELIPSFGELVYQGTGSTGPHIQVWKDYGFRSKLFSVNAGQSICIALGLLALLPLVGLGSLSSSKLGNYFKTKLKKFRWCAFLRLWLEVYIDVVAAATISVANISTETLGTFEYLLGVVWFVLGCLTPFLSFLYLVKAKVWEETTVLRCGTLFDEFQYQKGLGFMIYYPMFCLRRTVYVLILYFLKDYPGLQVFLNSFHSLCVLVYLVVWKPYNQKEINFLNILAEAAVTFSIASLGLFIQDSPDCFQWVMIGVISLVLLSSYLYILWKVYLFIKNKYFKKGVSVAPENANFVETFWKFPNKTLFNARVDFSLEDPNFSKTFH